MDTDHGPSHGEVVLRWYRRHRCAAVVAVGLTDLLARYRYTILAIVVTLWLWSVERWTDRQTRARTSPRPRGGVCRSERWITVRRWASAIRERRLWPYCGGAASETLHDYGQREMRIFAARGDPQQRDPLRQLWTAIAHAR